MVQISASAFHNKVKFYSDKIDKLHFVPSTKRMINYSLYVKSKSTLIFRLEIPSISTFKNWLL